MLVEICTWLLLLPICRFSKPQGAPGQPPSGSTFLPPGQTLLTYRLSHEVFFGGRPSRSLSIGSDGLVTVGCPSAGDDCASSTRSNGMSEFHPGARGPNAIAVFALPNQRRSPGAVRIRQLARGHGPDWGTRTMTTLVDRIQAIFGRHSTDPVTHVVEVAWLRMRPVGTTRHSENSFHLYLLSTAGRRTFCVIRHTRIRSRESLLSGTRLSYYSGLVLNGQRKFPVPVSPLPCNYPPPNKCAGAGECVWWAIALDKDLLAGNASWTPMETGGSAAVRTINVEHARQKRRSAEEGTSLLPLDVEITGDDSDSSAETLAEDLDKDAPDKLGDWWPSWDAGQSETRDSEPANKFSWTVERNVPAIERAGTSPGPSNSGSTESDERDPRVLPDGEGGEKVQNIVMNGGWHQGRPSSRAKDSGRRTACSGRRCRRNEECFRTAGGRACCRCRAGLAWRRGACVGRDSRFSAHANSSVRVSSSGAPLATLDLALTIAPRTVRGERVQRAILTLTSRQPMDADWSAFLLLLYPLFHVPLAFYAAPFSDQAVPNLNALVGRRARIDLQLAVEGHAGPLGVSFVLERVARKDRWVAAISGIDGARLARMGLTGSRLDEKSPTDTANLFYVLRNGSHVDFPDQTVAFQDEQGRRTVHVQWRGAARFSGSCLSHQIASRAFFVKFSDGRYCTSDCRGRPVRLVGCRLMCLGSPSVFESPADARLPVVPTIAAESASGCPQCGENARCHNWSGLACCVCLPGFVGLGSRCLERDSRVEWTGSGLLARTNDRGVRLPDLAVRLLFRQGASGAGRGGPHASHWEIGDIPYVSAPEQRFLHWLLLLSPLFDLPLAALAADGNGSHADNLFSLSRGALKVHIVVDSNLLSDVEIAMEMREQAGSLEISQSVAGIPSELGAVALPDTTRLFKQRSGSSVRYTVGRDRVSFERRAIDLPNAVGALRMWWRGTAAIHRCSARALHKAYVVEADPQRRCDVRCRDGRCVARCGAVAELQQASARSRCPQACHSAAQCLRNACVCRPGFSGNGFVCRRIRKILECMTSLECVGQPHTECRAGQCRCRRGFLLVGAVCTAAKGCQMCLADEICVRGECRCQPPLVRNRVSQRCVFDCSLCDAYSTECGYTGCICRAGFQSVPTSNTSCGWPCSSDLDCPTHERCLSTKVCHCPLAKEDGQCLAFDVCRGCHKNATCDGNRCTCGADWVGNGVNCSFDCSVCFDKSYCSPGDGCACPPAFKGDGKRCAPDSCGSRCPSHSTCVETEGAFRCVCEADLVMESDACVPDSVELHILPADRTIETFEGRSLDLICLGTSRRSALSLTWSRKSGRPVRGRQAAADASGKSVKLRLESVRKEDADMYTCSSGLGHQATVNISLGPEVPPCSGGRCGQFSVCITGSCVCMQGYISDGTQCTSIGPGAECPAGCPPAEVCNVTIGACQCGPGLVRAVSRCVEDCRLKPICHSRARCDAASGLCACVAPFTGNGTRCTPAGAAERNCLLTTAQCVPNSSCQPVAAVDQHLCLCHPGFVGNGHRRCYARVDCRTHRCGPHTLCEPVTVEDALGRRHLNGRCSCRPGHVSVNGICTATATATERRSQPEFWLAMGEALISHQEGGGRASIRYIDNQGVGDRAGGITALSAPACESPRLVWAGQGGAIIKSALSGGFSDTVAHLTRLGGRVTGLVADPTSDNVFFSDGRRGSVGVLDVERNISRVLLHLTDYSPGPLAIHHRSQRLFWVVNDYRDPRIECSLMTGEGRHVFVSLAHRALGVAVAEGSAEGLGDDDRLCWVEKAPQSVRVRHSRVKALLKCTSITPAGRATTAATHTTLIHRIRDHEPYSVLLHLDNTFYWNVRRGNFIKVLRANQESRIDITPKCCEAAVRALAVSRGRCQDTTNPCGRRSQHGKCPQLCIPRTSSSRKLEAVCLNSSP